MDILQELAPDKWPILQEKLKQLWPMNLPGYYTLKINLKCPRLQENFKFKVYCPYGDINNGFFAVSIKNNQHWIIFSTSEDTSRIEEAIIKTKLIEWNTGVDIDMTNSMILASLNRLRDRFTKYDVGMVTMYLLDGATKPFTDMRLPENTYTGPVKEEHIVQVDDAWPHRYTASHFYFKTLISNGLSYGLYSHTNELMAWVFINNYNFLLHLFCKDEYRRKGYAEYIMKWAVNEQLRDGNDIYAFVVKGNEKPIALFKKLGFRACDEGAFIEVEK